MLVKELVMLLFFFFCNSAGDCQVYILQERRVCQDEGILGCDLMAWWSSECMRGLALGDGDWLYTTPQHKAESTIT